MIETPNSNPPKELINIEEDHRNKMQLPFLSALRSKKKDNNAPEIFEILKQVKVNIPLLDMIKRIPPYAKFLKYLCIVK